jgi:hypothetical protein
MTESGEQANSSRDQFVAKQIGTGPVRREPICRAAANQFVAASTKDAQIITDEKITRRFLLF